MILVGVGITTAVWLIITLVTPVTDRVTLQNFYNRIRPLGPGWRAGVRIHPHDDRESLSAAFLCGFSDASLYTPRCLRLVPCSTGKQSRPVRVSHSEGVPWSHFSNCCRTQDSPGNLLRFAMSLDFCHASCIIMRGLPLTS
jgi:hypothetical protein